jgi:hypothetical protein
MTDGSKNTLGILEAFKDHVERWTEERMTAADVDAFRFIGTVATDRWPTITAGDVPCRWASPASGTEDSIPPRY